MAEPMDISSPDHSRKRSLPDDDQTSVSKSESQVPTPPLTASPANKDSIRQASPAPSSSALSSAPSGTNDQPTDPNAPPKKRRKYTPAEKEQRRLEKEQKDKERAELKVKRDEEKQKKDEEKRRKNEEKEAKQREKDLKKAREDEEKEKKLRAQPKIASFFKMPSSQKSPAAFTPVQPSPARQDNTSSQLVDADVPMPSPTPKRSPSQTQSDYRKMFLPFQLKAHTKCAPYVPVLNSDELETAQQEMDKVLQRTATTTSPTSSFSTLFAKERKRSRGLWQPTAREVIESLQGSSQIPIDLTDESGEHYRPTDLLDSLIVRHLHFGEDVRPAYFGTYSRKMSSSNASKLRKNPFSKLRKDTDYDYDSEAEWEEPEEGEDIGSDGEEDEESVGDAEEMDEFLEDDAADSKRHMITGDLKPVSTGLCWEDAKGLSKSSIDESPVDLDSMKIDFFLPLTQHSINPFSTSYWQTASTPAAVASKASGGQMQLDGKMKPPKVPLMPRSNTNDMMTIIGASSGMKGPIMSVASTKAAKPAPKPLQGPELAEFKDAVDGSNLTKVDLLKALKKRFPKHTNDTIKATLSSCFARIGQFEADKVWRAVAA
ncbi:hypothetical protein E4T48_00683 [Aureobasidium sp. EXF-10727]|nr:hypothetical protein E4T48_00683 [Aureobasidium sp. EXF-10727]